MIQTPIPTALVAAELACTLEALTGYCKSADACVTRADDLGTLEELNRAAAAVESATRLAVIRARRHGESWDAIGAALGVTRQAAHARWSRSLAL